MSDDSVCLSVCLSPVAHMCGLYKNYEIYHISVKWHHILREFCKPKQIRTIRKILLYQKLETFYIQDDWRTPCYISFLAITWQQIFRFSQKFCTIKQNPTIITVDCYKFQTSKIQKGRQPLSWKSLYRHISVKYNPILMKFCMLTGTITKLISLEPKLI